MSYQRSHLVCPSALQWQPVMFCELGNEMYGACGGEQLSPLMEEQRFPCLLEWDQKWVRCGVDPILSCTMASR